MQNAQIVIGIPALDTIKTETFTSLFSAARQIDYPTKLNIHTSCYVHDARNKIAQHALESGATHVMFIDSDMQFPPDGINKLVEQDKDIIGGLYFRRQAPHYPTINQREGDRLFIPDTFPTDKPFKVFAVGTGFMLIKTKVFAEIKPPWFYFGSFHGKAMGEDVYFCWKAGKKFDIWCDPRIELGHMGSYRFEKKDYDAYQEIRTKKKEDIFSGDL